MASGRSSPPIRPGRAADLAHLAAVEREAGARFGAIGMAEIAAGPTLPRAVLEAALSEGLLWVAEAPGGQPVGFLAASRMEGWLFVEEVSVVPDWAGQGIGRGLLDAASALAVARGPVGLALTTFRDVPWNAPYYARLGFTAVPEERQPPALRARLAEETAAGLAARVAMWRAA